MAVVGSGFSITGRGLFVGPRRDQGRRVDPVVAWALNATAVVATVEEVAPPVYSNLKSGDRVVHLGSGYYKTKHMYVYGLGHIANTVINL
jgi:hypothetical protein